MIGGGDEIGRTQEGNNNAYCQDNEISWFNWTLTPDERALWEFTRQMIALRKSHPVLHRRRFFRGRPIRGSEIRDITWYRSDGGLMTTEEWDTAWMRCIGMRLAGEATGELDEWGTPVSDDTLLIILNAAPEPVSFKLPNAHFGRAWEVLVDTGKSDLEPTGIVVPYGQQYHLDPRSFVLMRWHLRQLEAGFPGSPFHRQPR